MQDIVLLKILTRGVVMAINRYNLIRAISLARKNKDFETHDELLRIFYTLLEQEKIKNNFITEFTIYNSISESALDLISSSFSSKK